MTLSILYRGPLSSCNYDCSYCPFAKHRSPPEELEADRVALTRFADWVAEQDRTIGILLTPWGEALVRPWYREALVRLSHLPNVAKVAIQTNLSAPLSFVEHANRDTLAFWATYHPSEVSRGAFVDRVQRLHARGVKLSVGIVGTTDVVEEAGRLRAEVPDGVYVWVNAYKSEGPDYYRAHEVQTLRAVDPLFEFNNVRHPSFGRRCRTGSSVISVNGDGDVRRCHFVDDVLGNLYETPIAAILRQEPCPKQTCGCHIGYVHLEHLDLYAQFGEGVLERIPSRLPVLPSAEVVR